MTPQPGQATGDRTHPSLATRARSITQRAFGSRSPAAQRGQLQQDWQRQRSSGHRHTARSGRKQQFVAGNSVFNTHAAVDVEIRWCGRRAKGHRAFQRKLLLGIATAKGRVGRTALWQRIRITYRRCNVNGISVAAACLRRDGRRHGQTFSMAAATTSIAAAGSPSDHHRHTRSIANEWMIRITCDDPR